MIRRWAHPHSRGENEYVAWLRAAQAGSSPLTRGKLVADAFGRGCGGLIPTHAGKTSMTAPSPSRRTAHPHSRGENGRLRASACVRWGSSPLTRGKRVGAMFDLSVCGLIPTHAGKTYLAALSPPKKGAHPHSRGENLEEHLRRTEVEGSSPLTRGKHFLTCAFIAQIGQILESLELCASSESYSLMDAYATDAPQDQVRSTGLAPRRSRDAS